MPTKAVYLMIVPGFADWEPAHTLAELRRHGGYRVEVVGLSSAPVESMGGLRVQPSRSLAEVNPADVAVFILPGGDRWESLPLEPELAALLEVCQKRTVGSTVRQDHLPSSLGAAYQFGCGRFLPHVRCRCGNAPPTRDVPGREGARIEQTAAGWR